MTSLPVILAELALLAGLFYAWKHWTVHRAKAFIGGWVYFIAGEGTDVHVGISQYDPDSKAHIAAYRDHSPVPMSVYFKFRTDNRLESARHIRQNLSGAKIRGDWYERDAALSFAAYLRDGDRNAQEQEHQGDEGVFS